MKDTLKVLLDANVDKLFVVFGLLLLVVAVVGKVKDWFDPGPVGRALAVFIGSSLAIFGVGLWAIGLNPALLNPQQAADGRTRAVNPAPVNPTPVEPIVSDAPVPQPKRFNLTGTYQGTEQFTNGIGAGVVARFVWTSEQEDNEVTGSYTNQAGDFGTFSATIKGSAMSGRFVSQAIPGMACNFESTLTRGGAIVSGALVCLDGQRARFTGNRQQ